MIFMARVDDSLAIPMFTRLFMIPDIMFKILNPMPMPKMSSKLIMRFSLIRISSAYGRRKIPARFAGRLK